MILWFILCAFAAFIAGYWVGCMHSENEAADQIEALKGQQALDADRIAALMERLTKSSSGLKQTVEDNSLKPKTLKER